MSCRSRNCCRFNHPCPIWCPCARRVCTNEVVNPIISESFGFFNNTSIGTVAPDATLPLSLITLSGSGIAPNSSGGILLSSGTYQISYFANGTIPASGVVGVKLQLNGVDVSGSDIFENGTISNLVTMSQTILLSVNQTATLELVNASNDAAAYSLGSILIRRI